MQSLQQSQFRLESASSINPTQSVKTETAEQPKDIQNNLVMEEEDEISDEEMMVNSIFTNKKTENDVCCELEERKRPIGKSPEALESSSGPKDSSSPILLAPIAKDDSCDSLGETSTITLQRYFSSKIYCVRFVNRVVLHRFVFILGNHGLLALNFHFF